MTLLRDSLVLLKAKMKQNMKVFLWLTLFKQSVSVLSSWGIISVIPVRCCHGTPVGESCSEGSSGSSTFVVALASEAPAAVSQTSWEQETKWHLTLFFLTHPDKRDHSLESKYQGSSCLPPAWLPRLFLQLKYTSTQFEKPKIGRRACRFQLG